MSLKSFRLFVVFVLAAIVMFTAMFVSASDMDNRIESSIKQSYVFKTYLKDDSISVNSKNGVVTLVGTVREDSHKSLAKETAEDTPGVKKVNNQLVYKGELPAENSDGWIIMKVKTALMFHPSVSVIATGVDAKDGVVTLRGEASSQAQKELAGQYALDVEGVKDVKNNMTLAANPAHVPETLGDKIDDASITAFVKLALLTHRSTSMIKTKVRTTNGVVTLHGQAKNDAEKALVGKLASDIKGVTSVVNNMTVQK